jgi:hypothetical protein
MAQKASSCTFCLLVVAHLDTWLGQQTSQKLSLGHRYPRHRTVASKDVNRGYLDQVSQRDGRRVNLRKEADHQPQCCQVRR